MPENFDAMELPALMDRLAEYTAKYTHSLTNGGLLEDIDKWEHIIRDLQTEIKKKKGRSVKTWNESDSQH